MLKKLRHAPLARAFATNDRIKVGFFAPCNTFVLQESLYLTNLNQDQQKLISTFNIDELITSHLPQPIQDLPPAKTNLNDANRLLSGQFAEFWKEAVAEVAQYRSDQKAAAAQAAENPEAAPQAPEESKQSKRFASRMNKFNNSVEKPVCFDPMFHSMFHVAPPSGRAPLDPNTPEDLQQMIDRQTVASLSKVTFFTVAEEKLKGRVCRMEGFGTVRIHKRLDPQSFKLQQHFQHQFLERLDGHQTDFTNISKLNPLQAEEGIQGTIDITRKRLTEENLDEVLGNEEELWDQFHSNGFIPVEFEVIPDTYRLVVRLKEDEYQHFLEILWRISASVRLFADKKMFAKSLGCDVVNTSDRTLAVVYINSVIAHLKAKFVLGPNDIFLLTNEPDLLVRAVVVAKIIERFSKDYNSSWSIMESKYRHNSRNWTKEEEAKGMDALYDQFKRYYDENSPASKRQIIEKVTKLLKTAKLSNIVRKGITEELTRFGELNEHDSDYQNLKSYLDVIIKMPFGRFSVDNHSLKRASKILDDSHYGMEEIKKRILQFLAVSGTKGSLINKKIICLVGPPGVGKTSISKAIAESLGRKFVRISLGGENDVALLKGHRRTYMGAYPGKIVNALKMAGTENPVILLDEVDKVSKNAYKGNIQDVLLEILDPSQNHSFYDHYLDLPVDLSKVLFLCSANVLDSSTVSAALYDRMEVIELSGYTKNEKFSIFHKHLLPKIHKKMGLDRFNVRVNFSPAVIDQLINDYAREPGVRNLDKMLLKIYEKIAYDFFKKNHDAVLESDTEQKPTKEGVPVEVAPLPHFPETTYEITSAMVREFLGPRRFFSQTIFHEKEDLVGFAFGLGYNAFGGSVLSIEVLEVPSLASGSGPHWDFLPHIENISITRPAVREPEPGSSENEVGVPENTKQEGSLIATGSLGTVMKESVEIAYSFAKFYLYKANKDPSYLESKNLHIHFPEGASKKDGPSAGITIVSALISAATRIPFNPEFAMTGEISLNGKVLKIGGLREKVLAAKREGICKIIAPKANAREVEEMKDEVKEGVEFHFVENYDEVYQLLFESKDPAV